MTFTGFRFRPVWFRPSKWNLVSACRRRSTALLSGPSLTWLSLCNMTDVSSSVYQWQYTECVTAHISVLSCLNLPRRCRTVVVNLLHFIVRPVGYLDRSSLHHRVGCRGVVQTSHVGGIILPSPHPSLPFLPFPSPSPLFLSLSFPLPFPFSPLLSFPLPFP